MALRKDGNSRASVSRKPYDPNQSLIKKMANRVTTLIGWHSSSQQSRGSQNCDNISSSVDEESDSPSAKRIRVDDDILYMPSSGTNDVCSPIQPINDINALGTTTSNRCIISSTPACQLSNDKNMCVTNIRSNAVIPPKPITVPSLSIEAPDEYRSHNSSSFENNESVNSALISPQLNIQQRHNVTVPAISRKVPNQSVDLDRSKLSGTFLSSNTRGPSFNVDVFSGSSRRLSMSVCENRNSSSLSPFYSARTMYGGASALLPYGNQSIGRMRLASTSKLNLFAPRNRISIQPVPKPAKPDDQETMSATARKILDTIEKYCSPVSDAKKIPLNDSRTASEAHETSTNSQPLSKGVKRKLPTLSQVTPSTSDLLRIKRQEQMEESVSNARLIKSSVPESSILADDSDSSDSVDLDYSMLKEDSKTTNSQKYFGKIKRKQESKIEASTVTPVKLPKAVLKITNLPKFDITDTFTFSKPLLIENMDDNVTDSSLPNDTASKDDCTVLKHTSVPTTSVNISFNPTKSTSTSTASCASLNSTSKIPQNAAAAAKKEVDLPKPTVCPFLSSSLSFNNSECMKTTPWTCRVCSLECTSKKCSSCTNTHEANEKLAQVTKSAGSKNESFSKSPLPTTNKNIKSAEVSNSKCALDSEKSSLTTSALSSDLNLPQPNDLWKNLTKSGAGCWNCDTCLVKNEAANSECVACSTPKDPSSAPAKKSDAVFTTSKYSFGVDKVDAAPTSCVFSSDKSTPFSSTVAAVSGSDTSAEKSNYVFGGPSSLNSTASTVPSSTSSASPLVFVNAGTTVKSADATTTKFTFGRSKGDFVVEPASCNAIGMKNPLLSGMTTNKSSTESQKPIENDKGSSVFNDLSSTTNNTKNPLLKPVTVNEVIKDVNAFKTPKMVAAKSLLANKENGEDTSISNIFNNIGSSDKESPPPPPPPPPPQQPQPPNKDSPFTTFEATTKPSIFSTNGFAKSENLLTAAASTTPNSLFVSSNFTAAPTKLNKDIQSIFNTTSSKVEPAAASEANETTGIFTNVNNFASSASSVNKNSIFTNFNSQNFNSPKPESQSFNSGLFSATPNVSFGSSNVSLTNNSSSQPSGGFAMNGPKIEAPNQPKFLFGGSTSTGDSNSFGNSTFGSVAVPTFAADQTVTNAASNEPVSQLFQPGNSMKTPFKMQQTNSAGLNFGNAVFGAQQQPHPMKKSGGFQFGAPSSPFVEASVNFTNSTAGNQDHNLLSARPPASNLFSADISNSQNQGHNFNMGPPIYNFSSGNPVPTFSAQPTANNTIAPATNVRRVRKAARRLK